MFTLITVAINTRQSQNCFEVLENKLMIILIFPRFSSHDILTISNECAKIHNTEAHVAYYAFTKKAIDVFSVKIKFEQPRLSS